jgi:putative addiction module CopG family antidote
MEINLPPALASMVREKVASGLYRDEEEVMTEALRRMMESDAGLEWLRKEAAAGFDQLDAGGSVEMTRDEFLTRARQRHAA